MSADATSRVGRISQLDQSTLLRLQAGCNYINAEVEKRRKTVIVVGVLAVLASVFVFFRWQTDPRVIFAGVMVAVMYGAHAQRQVAKTYKHIVVGRVVKALGHGLTYSAESKFTRQDFLDMDLFEKRAEKLQSEDEVAGRKNAVSYSILEAKATRTEGSGKNRRTVIIFRGVIVRLDFNKHFHGHTVVVPDRESKVLGGLFGEAESRRRKQLARMENVEFENAYSVYTTDQQEARYLLTPKLMELMMQARLLFGGDVRFSFHDNSVFATIPQSTDRFEVGLFGRRITPESACGELAEVVQLAERMVEALDLETRIWTRV